MTFSRIPKGILAIGASLVLVLGQTPLAGPVAAVGTIGAPSSAVPSSASAPSAPAAILASIWTPSFTLAPVASAGDNSDLSAAGGYVAAAWVQQPSSSTAGSEVWVRTSPTSGTTWQPAVRLSANPSMWADQVSLTSDAASGTHFAVWKEFTISGGVQVFMSKKAFGSGSWTAPTQVSDNTGNSAATGPSLVVTPAYYFLTYTRSPSSGSTTNRLRIFNRSTGIWAPSINLATLAYATGVVRLAAASTKVAMVWSTPSGAVMLRRGTIGSGSSPAITWSTSSLGSLSPGQTPFFVLSGTRGVVGWAKNGDVFVRRTTDGGATWSPATKVLDGTTTNGYGAIDAAMSGLNVVFTGERSDQSMFSIQGGYGLRMTSANAGATWTKTTSYSILLDNRQVAYVNKPSSGGLKVVAEAWTNSTVSGGPFKVMYHRHT